VRTRLRSARAVGLAAALGLLVGLALLGIGAGRETSHEPTSTVLEASSVAAFSTSDRPKLLAPQPPTARLWASSAVRMPVLPDLGVLAVVVALVGACCVAASASPSAGRAPPVPRPA
jgi:hypothetical protein